MALLSWMPFGTRTMNKWGALNMLGKILKENPGTYLTIRPGMSGFVVAYRNDKEELDFMDGETISDAMYNLLDDADLLE